MYDNYFGEQIGLPGNNFLDDQMQHSGMEMQIFSQIANWISGGSPGEVANKENVKNQNEYNEQAWEHQKTQQRDSEAFNQQAVDYARSNNQQMVDFQNSNASRDWQIQNDLQADQYQSDYDAWTKSGQINKDEKAFNKGGLTLANKETDAWLEEQRTAKGFQRQQQKFEIGKASNEAAIKYSNQALDFKVKGQEIKNEGKRATQALGQASKAWNSRSTNLTESERLAKLDAKQQDSILDKEKGLVQDRWTLDKTKLNQQNKLNQYQKTLTQAKAGADQTRADDTWEQAKNRANQAKLNSANVEEEALNIIKGEKKLETLSSDARTEQAKLDKTFAIDSASAQTDLLNAQSTKDTALAGYAYDIEKAGNDLTIGTAGTQKDIIAKELGMQVDDIDGAIAELGFDEAIRKGELSEELDDLSQKQREAILQYGQKKADIAQKQEEAMVEGLIQKGAATAQGRAGASAKRAIQSTMAAVGRQQAALSNSLINVNAQQTETTSGLQRKKDSLVGVGGTAQNAKAGSISDQKAKRAAAKSQRLTAKKENLVGTDGEGGLKALQQGIQDLKVTAAESKTSTAESIKTAKQTGITDSTSANQDLIDAKETQAKGSAQERIDLENDSKESRKEIFDAKKQQVKDRKSNEDELTNIAKSEAKISKDYSTTVAAAVISNANDVYTAQNTVHKAEKLYGKQKKNFDKSAIGQRQKEVQNALDKTLNELGFQTDTNNQTYKAAKQDFNQGLKERTQASKNLIKDNKIQTKDIKQTFQAVKTQQNINKQMSIEKLKSAKQSAGFSDLKNQRAFDLAETNRKAKKLPKPVRPTAIPAPYEIPYTQFQDAFVGGLPPKPKDGVAAQTSFGAKLFGAVEQGIGMAASMGAFS